MDIYCPYKLLKVTRGETTAEILKKGKKICLENHTDKGIKEGDKIAKINRALEIFRKNFRLEFDYAYDNYGLEEAWTTYNEEMAIKSNDHLDLEDTIKMDRFLRRSELDRKKKKFRKPKSQNESRDSSPEVIYCETVNKSSSNDNENFDGKSRQSRNRKSNSKVEKNESSSSKPTSARSNARKSNPSKSKKSKQNETNCETTQENEKPKNIKNKSKKEQSETQPRKSQRNKKPNVHNKKNKSKMQPTTMTPEDFDEASIFREGVENEAKASRGEQLENIIKDHESSHKKAQKRMEKEAEKIKKEAAKDKAKLKKKESKLEKLSKSYEKKLEELNTKEACRETNTQDTASNNDNNNFPRAENQRDTRRTGSLSPSSSRWNSNHTTSPPAKRRKFRLYSDEDETEPDQSSSQDQEMSKESPSPFQEKCKASPFHPQEKSDNSKPKVLTCDSCVFRRREKHAVIEDPKGKVYTLQDSYTRHLKSHKTPGFSCDFDGCSKLFYRSDELTRHKQRAQHQTKEKTKTV